MAAVEMDAIERAISDEFLERMLEHVRFVLPEPGPYDRHKFTHQSNRRRVMRELILQRLREAR